MGKSKQLTKSDKLRILDLVKAGMSQTNVANIFKVSQSLISKTVKRNAENVSLSPKKRSGRPRVTSSRTDRRIVNLVQQIPNITSAEIKDSFPGVLDNVDPSTIRTRLTREFKIMARRPLKKPLVTPVMRQKRLAFCQKYKEWTPEQWRRVMFSDESMFRQFSNRTQFVRRPQKSSPCNPKYTAPTVKHSPSIMVWGSFSAAGRGGLFFLPKGKMMNGEQYKIVLEEHLINFMHINGCTVFQHDSAPCHTARVVKAWLTDNNISMLDWPGNSPDLNPIENLWVLLKKGVCQKNSANLKELKQNIMRVWCTEVTSHLCETLADSMPRRIAEVIKNKGYPTKY